MPPSLPRICIVYDCLYPWTVGGAEAWYRSLAEDLATKGHEVTYLTLRQWDVGDLPQIPGVEVVAVGPKLDLYVDERRKIAPPLLFGWGVTKHLIRARNRYDIVHLASFPYFSLLAAALARRTGSKFQIICDWHEVWSNEYWRSYLGSAGLIGWNIQKLCAKTSHQATTFSDLHSRRLRTLNKSLKILKLEGEINLDVLNQVAATDPVASQTSNELLFAGRLIREKRVDLLLNAFALNKKTDSKIVLNIVGEGPELNDLKLLASKLKVSDSVCFHGFVSREKLDGLIVNAACVINPSSREGYGRIVVEAAALNIPVIVVPAADNAAVELVNHDENGVIANGDSPESLAAAIEHALQNQQQLRQTTRTWFEKNRDRLSITSSLEQISRLYAQLHT